MEENKMVLPAIAIVLAALATAGASDTVDGKNVVRGPDGQAWYSFPAHEDK